MMTFHLICAARPNFMKVAPLYHALRKEPRANPVLVHTGQHYDPNMSDTFFEDLRLPMPEEINRLVTDALADLLLTPSPDADENLKHEGIPASRIRLVGNIMIDALVTHLEQARRSPLPGQLGLQQKSFAYVTLHRPSNV